MSNKFNPPYIMPHFVFQMHYGAPPPSPVAYLLCRAVDMGH